MKKNDNKNRKRRGSIFRPRNKKRFEERKKEMKEKGITIEDEAKRIFKEIGINLETELIEYY